MEGRKRETSRKFTKVYADIKIVKKCSGVPIYFNKSKSSSQQWKSPLALKAPITTAGDNIHKYFFIVFSEKIRLDVSSESFAGQFLFGVLRVKEFSHFHVPY